MPSPRGGFPGWPPTPGNEGPTRLAGSGHGKPPHVARGSRSQRHQADALIAYAKQVKDWPLLEQAIDAKLGGAAQVCRRGGMLTSGCATAQRPRKSIGDRDFYLRKAGRGRYPDQKPGRVEVAFPAEEAGQVPRRYCTTRPGPGRWRKRPTPRQRNGPGIPRVTRRPNTSRRRARSWAASISTGLYNTAEIRPVNETRHAGAVEAGTAAGGRRAHAGRKG